MDDRNDLALILKSHFPIVVVETHEEARVLALLESVCQLEYLPYYTWSVANGLVRRDRGGVRDWSQDTTGLHEALRHIEYTPQNGVFALLDAQPYLDNPLNVRLIKEIAGNQKKARRTLVLVGPGVTLPADLKRFSARFELSLLDAAGVRKLFREEAELWQQAGNRLRGQQEAAELLVQHLAGLCVEDARRMLRQAIRDDGAITMADVGRVLRQKHEALGAGGVLQLELDTGSFAGVVGLANLKRWLDRRKRPFLQGDAAALEAPRGVLLLGVQGAGKSLAAKAIAGGWGVPLLRLDFASLYSKWSGETEKNLRETLRVAEAMAPCVLWIDEIEKGLGVGGSDDSDGGVSRRVLGTLLTWMTERKSRVFLAATANDIARLPPELLRKGRFDEIFFVDLPGAPARAEIFRLHLARRGQDPARFDLPALAAAAEGFSGAEIEQAVISALYEAQALGAAPEPAHVLAEIARTRPLSVVMKEQVDALREWASSRTVPAD